MYFITISIFFNLHSLFTDYAQNSFLALVLPETGNNFEEKKCILKRNTVMYLIEISLILVTFMIFRGNFS